MGKLATPVAKLPSKTAATPSPTIEGAEPAVSGSASMVGMGAYRYGPSALGLPDDVQSRMDTQAGVPPSPTAPPSAPADPNRTGLPDPLKQGVERLAGVDLSRVRVHYRSPEPARFDALAYAFGSEIHLAPGQERHLPHETWHLAQQAQGRVAPTVQWKRDVPGNEDAALEREADRMGEAALRPKAAAVTDAGSRPTRALLPTAARGVLQRTPQEALDLLPPSEAKDNLTRLLATATQIAETFPLMTRHSDSYQTVKTLLTRGVRLVEGTIGPGFTELWNRDPQNGGPQKGAFNHVPKSRFTSFKIPAVKHPAPFTDSPETENYLAQWLYKPLKEKSSAPDRKFAKAIPLLLNQAPFPEAVATALKLYFAHTANFVPVDNLGRDYQAKDHGKYYRSSNDPVRKGNAKLLKDFAQRYQATTSARFPSKYTAQVTNHPLHLALQRHGALKKQINQTQFISPAGYPDSIIAVYQSVAGTHTGSLGQIQNVYKTLQVGAHTRMPPPIAATPSSSAPMSLPAVASSPPAGIPMSMPGGPSTSASVVPPRNPGLLPVVGEDRLASATTDNYHDRLLADRSALVAGVAREISSLYPSGGTRWRVVPIQSPTHASLILELVDPAGGEILAESQWRELFIPTFNAVAKTLGVQTRATHRGSFGFLHPTVSSVGGPVRIWPGLTPPNLFRQLVLDTLARLAETDARFQPPTTHGRPAPPDQASWASTASDIPLYQEALKTAVRYAQDTMRGIQALDGPPRFVQWVLVRLQHNLVRADYLLSLAPPTTAAERETDYLKSASLIENLMEHSYLLEAFNTQVPAKPQDTPDDPYPGYLRRTLNLVDGETHHTATYYLDSGMQAIVTANLLVRAWNRQKDPRSATQSLESIDLNSYFEYAAIDKENLKVVPINRGTKGFQGPSELKRTLNARAAKRRAAPHIVAADLNPVLTSSAGRASLVPPKDVLDRVAKYGKHGGKTVNDRTVPIIDVTNAPLSAAAGLTLHEGYENFIIVESLSKHQQLGADKFTMGRLNVVGSAAFLACAKTLIEPIEAAAFHRLPAAYRLRMDRIFYGGGGTPAVSQAPASSSSSASSLLVPPSPALPSSPATRYRPRPTPPARPTAVPIATNAAAAVDTLPPPTRRGKRPAVAAPALDDSVSPVLLPTSAPQPGPPPQTTFKRARGAGDPSPSPPIVPLSQLTTPAPWSGPTPGSSYQAWPTSMPASSSSVAPAAWGPLTVSTPTPQFGYGSGILPTTSMPYGPSAQPSVSTVAPSLSSMSSLHGPSNMALPLSPWPWQAIQPGSPYGALPWPVGQPSFSSPYLPFVSIAAPSPPTYLDPYAMYWQQLASHYVPMTAHQPTYAAPAYVPGPAAIPAPVVTQPSPPWFGPNFHGGPSSLPPGQGNIDDI